MRPLNKDEQDGELIVKKVSNDSLTINGHTFTFDSVADMESNQASLRFYLNFYSFKQRRLACERNTQFLWFIPCR